MDYKCPQGRHTEKAEEPKATRRGGRDCGDTARSQGGLHSGGALHPALPRSPRGQGRAKNRAGCLLLALICSHSLIKSKWFMAPTTQQHG